MNNLEEPEITFVVPAYNTQHTISRTIDSILGQTDDRYRIIIVNDGSTDNTEKICEEYAKKYPQKINYVYQENRGLGGARNHGIQLTDTRYISFLDSDDWLMPDQK
jgi:glycosyltransferase involved in cell wall biosynthesis